MATDTKQEYQGPGKITSMAGDYTVDGIVGSVVGAAAGAAIGAATGGQNRAATALSFSAIGAGIVGAIGSIVGLFTGYKKAAHGKEQFEQLAADKAALEAKVAETSQALTAMGTELKEQKSFVAALHKERAPHHQGQEHAAGHAR